MKSIIPIPTEAEEQRALFEYASYHPILKDYLIAIPNGGKRTKVNGYNMKMQGLKSGVPDIFLAYPSKNYHGLWIELKRNVKNVRISKNQSDWILRLSSKNYAAVVCKGKDNAIDILTRYLNNESFYTLQTLCIEVKNVELL